MTKFVPPHVPPAPRPVPFPRNLSRLLDNNLGIIPQAAYENGVTLAPGPPKIAFITGAEEVETLLKKEAARFPKGRLQNEVLEPIFGDAMISSEGADWKWQRAITAPLFRHEELLRYVPVMQSAAEAQIAEWQKSGRQSRRAINRDMLRAAFAVISRTMLEGGADDVVRAIETGHAAYFRNVNWWILYRMFGLPSWLPRPGGAVMRAQERKLHDAVGALVDGRMEANSGGPDTNDLLGRLVRGQDPATGEAMSRQRLVNNIIAFLVAGYDTTALALSWTLYLLAQSPEWTDKIYREVEEVAGTGPIRAEHLGQLVKTEQVINETLRLYPTAPVIVRDFLQDTELGGTVIPRGAIGLVPIYAIHRHRRFWKEPDVFDPGRFGKEAGSRPGRFQFLPFGAGPRICLGAAFTMIEAKVMLANFVRAARFEIDGDFVAEPVGRMFLTMRQNIPLQVTLR